MPFVDSDDGYEVNEATMQIIPWPLVKFPITMVAWCSCTIRGKRLPGSYEAKNDASKENFGSVCPGNSNIEAETRTTRKNCFQRRLPDAASLG